MPDEENKPAAEDEPKSDAPAENQEDAPAAQAEDAPATKAEDAPAENQEEAPATKAEEAPAEKPEDAPAAQAKAEAEIVVPAEQAATEGAAEAPKPDEKKPGGEKGAGADIFLALDPTEGEKPKILKAKGSKNVHNGIVHILATFNNTIVTVTDMNGNVVGWSSAGKMGFKGSRKSTAYAAQLVSQDACRQAMGHGLKEAEVRVKGPGSGRESAVRAVQGIGIDVVAIVDATPIPHNGCRPPKPRRV
ncbi:hypothetical protein BH23VER1_BH23VER1_29530 [soil metagenome]